MIGTTYLASLRTSSRLTSAFRRMYRAGFAMARPEKVIRVLNAAGVRFVVMGTHGVGAYRKQARATQDVDVLVRPRDHEKAVAAIEKAYRKLVVTDYAVVTRFSDPADGEPVIDLMKPSFPLLQAVFKNSARVAGMYLIPTLDMALASKFAAMVSPHRAPDKKHIDAGDFINIVRHNRDAIDRKKLLRLGNLVYPGGGSELIRLVDDAEAGRTIVI